MIRIFIAMFLVLFSVSITNASWQEHYQWKAEHWNGVKDKYGNMETENIEAYIDHIVYDHKTQKWMLYDIAGKLIASDHATRISISDGHNIYHIVKNKVVVICLGSSTHYSAIDRICAFDWKYPDVIVEQTKPNITMLTQGFLNKLKVKQIEDFKQKEAIHKKHDCCRAKLPIPENLGPVKSFTQQDEM